MDILIFLIMLKLIAGNWSEFLYIYLGFNKFLLFSNLNYTFIKSYIRLVTWISPCSHAPSHSKASKSGWPVGTYSYWLKMSPYWLCWFDPWISPVWWTKWHLVSVWFDVTFPGSRMNTGWPCIGTGWWCAPVQNCWIFRLFW